MKSFQIPILAMYLKRCGYQSRLCPIQPLRALNGDPDRDRSVNGLPSVQPECSPADFQLSSRRQGLRI